jgi:hypothetical protein
MDVGCFSLQAAYDKLAKSTNDAGALRFLSRKRGNGEALASSQLGEQFEYQRSIFPQGAA